jgi:hypothetical protein
MRIYLQTLPSTDSPPRFYHLFLERDLLDGWNVIRESGVQGASGRLQKAHYPTREAAEEALVQSRDAQIRRGYRIVFAQGQEPPERA